MSTIVAPATPMQAAGLGVIRLSGEDAISIADRVFQAVSGKKLSEKGGYTAAFGHVLDERGTIDEAVALVFRAPKSYTGENVVEFSVHGGVYVMQKLLAALYNAGAVPAAPGEFTRRAFENGKMTLTQAEAVIDTINAQSEAALKAAGAVREGALYRRIKASNDALVGVLAHLSAWIDYPDEEIEDITENDFLTAICRERDSLTALKNGFEQGRVLREGITTAIVGKPNVGKSTLMNLLAGTTRSIVTAVAGTTRDVVEETVRLGSTVLRLADTAGLHQTDDTVEQIGVQMAKDRLESADLVLAVFDSSLPLDEDDRQILALVNNRRAIAVVNKTDLAQKLDLSALKAAIPTVVEMSAKNDANAAALQEAVEIMFAIQAPSPDAGLIANTRQLACLNVALEHLTEAKDCLEQGFTLDAVDVCVQSASQALLELSGEAVTDAVVDTVFKNFCVGK